MKAEKIILQEKINIYNNIATLFNCEGRLTVNFQIYPDPRIYWEFESYDKKNITSQLKLIENENIPNPLKDIEVMDSKMLSPYWQIIMPDGNSRLLAKGLAFEMIFGNITSKIDCLIFYFPNTRYQKISHHSKMYSTTIKDEEGKIIHSRLCNGNYIESQINNLNIRLEIERNTLNWLDPQQKNFGTFITSKGMLSSNNKFIFKKGVDILLNLSLFLSYANGGYITPLYLEGHNFNKRKRHILTESTCAMVQTREVTPLEDLSNSWLTKESNLEKYLECFLTFKKMIQNKKWKDTFYFILPHYFVSTNIKYSWQQSASSIGAILERLSYMILVEEETDLQRKNKYELLFDIKKNKKAKNAWNLGDGAGKENISMTNKRLNLLLNRIGLSKDRGLDDIDYTKKFLEVRNNAVHPIETKISLKETQGLIERGIQWVDEVLLWRFGYNEAYLRRIPFDDRFSGPSDSTMPRYDLTKRNSNW